MGHCRSVTIFSIIALSSLQPMMRAEEHLIAVSPDAALAILKEGNQRFVSRDVTAGKAVAASRAATAETQHPFAIIVGCADSRTSPELVFDQNIGDLFVIRTAGNLVDEHALGSIEYAVEHLGSRLVVVLGHERCGAVKAALGNSTAPGNINSIVRDIQPAVQAAANQEGDAVAHTVLENARQVAAHIQAKVELGELASEIRIVTAVYDLDSGIIEWDAQSAPATAGPSTSTPGGGGVDGP